MPRYTLHCGPWAVTRDLDVANVAGAAALAPGLMPEGLARSFLRGEGELIITPDGERPYPACDVWGWLEAFAIYKVRHNWKPTGRKTR